MISFNHTNSLHNTYCTVIATVCVLALSGKEISPSLTWTLSFVFYCVSTTPTAMHLLFKLSSDRIIAQQAERIKIRLVLMGASTVAKQIISVFLPKFEQEEWEDSYHCHVCRINMMLQLTWHCQNVIFQFNPLESQKQLAIFDYLCFFPFYFSLTNCVISRCLVSFFSAKPQLCIYKIMLYI